MYKAYTEIAMNVENLTPVTWSVNAETAERAEEAVQQDLDRMDDAVWTKKEEDFCWTATKTRSDGIIVTVTKWIDYA